MTQKSIDNMLAEFREKRRQENDRIKKKLAESRKKRQVELKTLLNRNELAEEVKERGRTEQLAGDNEPKDTTADIESFVDKEAFKEDTVEEAVSLAEEEVDDSSLDSINKQQIIEVIKDNPEGIKLSSIGKELGVHYIAIASQIKELVDSGQIEKDDLLYKIRADESDPDE